MSITKPITFNNNPITGNQKVKNFGRKLFWSLCCPVIFLIIAEVLSLISSSVDPTSTRVVGLFFTGTSAIDNLTSIMSILRTLTMTLIAALALNTNLNSGRMDFSLGATGILACLLASLFVGIDTPGHIFIFLLLSIVFGMILGFIHSLILIWTKLPPIVVSLGMCLVYEGISQVVANAAYDTASVKLTSGSHTTSFFLEPIILIPLLIIVCLIMAAALCYTRYGYNKLALVYDQKICVDTGINEISHCIVSFIIAGALIAIYQVMSTCGTAGITISVNLGSSGTVFKNFLPIFIGGILAKYNNQIVGLLLGCFATTVLYQYGFDNATVIGLSATISSLLNGFSVFAVLVYMVDKQRFINWVKMKRYIKKEKYLYPTVIKESK
jgi:ribose transport system permease protein